MAWEFIILEPTGSVWIDVSERGIFNRRKGPDQVDQVAVLCIDSGIILTFFLLLDPFKLGLEVKSVTHLIEEERQEEITPIVVESAETGSLYITYGLNEFITVWQSIGHWAVDCSRHVQIRQEVTWLSSVLHQLVVLSAIIDEVSLTINGQDQIIDTFVCVFVRVGEFETHQEGVHP